MPLSLTTVPRTYRCHRPYERGVMAEWLRLCPRGLWASIADSVHFGLHKAGFRRCVYLRTPPQDKEERYVWAVRHLPCVMLERSSR